MISLYSPYQGVSFFEFFFVFFSRLFSGKFFTSTLYIDDIQIVVFALLAVSGSIVGVFLVLKKMAMYANAVSHTVLLGLVFVCLITHQLTSLSLEMLTLASIITALCTGFLIYFIRNVFRISEEASTALVFSLLFSLSLILLVFLTQNAHIGTELIMGNADALARTDLLPVFMICVVNVIVFTLFYRLFFCVSFDSVFSGSLGLPIKTIDYLMILQLSASLVAAFKAVGVLMALGFLLIPSLIAKIFVSSVKQMVVFSLVFGLAAALLAPACSRAILTVYKIGISTSGISICILVLFYMLTVLITYCRRAYISKRS